MLCDEKKKLTVDILCIKNYESFVYCFEPQGLFSRKQLKLNAKTVQQLQNFICTIKHLIASCDYPMANPVS